MELIIDNRERHLIEALRGVPRTPDSTDMFVVRTLDLGDIHITNEGLPLIVIERKTVADAEASIKDGRYKEQKARLQSSGIARIIYLIEGVATDRVYGMVVNTMVRDGILVHCSADLSDTVKFLTKIMENLPKYIDAIGVPTVAPTIAKKKDSLTPAACFRRQLCQVPGISDAKAAAIAAIFPSMSAIIMECAADKGAFVKKLCGIEGIGKVMAANIITYVCT